MLNSALPMFSSISFIIFSIIFRSLIQCKFIFLYDIRGAHVLVTVVSFPFQITIFFLNPFECIVYDTSIGDANQERKQPTSFTFTHILLVLIILFMEKFREYAMP